MKQTVCNVKSFLLDIQRQTNCATAIAQFNMNSYFQLQHNKLNTNNKNSIE